MTTKSKVQLIPSDRAREFTFGIEIECVLPRQVLEDCAISVGGYHSRSTEAPYPHFPRNWRVENDSSLCTNPQHTHQEMGRGCDDDDDGCDNYVCDEDYVVAESSAPCPRPQGMVSTRRSPILNSFGATLNPEYWPNGRSICNCHSCCVQRLTHQTEFTNAWLLIYDALQRRLMTHTPQRPIHIPNRTHIWNEDAFTCLEFISPILSGVDGLEQIAKVLKFIREHGGYVNNSCGQHIHIGVDSVTKQNWLSNPLWLSRFFTLVAAHERALYAVNGKQDGRLDDRRRIDTIKRSPNAKKSAEALQMYGEAVELLRTHGTSEEVISHLTSDNERKVFSSRSSVVSTTSLREYGTLEFRVFDATLDTDLTFGRIQLVLGLAEKALGDSKVRWESLAHAKSYPGKFRGERNLERLFSHLGWKGIAAKKKTLKRSVCLGWLRNDEKDKLRVMECLRNAARDNDQQNPQGKRMKRNKRKV